MKEIQIPRKNFARSSDPATKRLIKDPETKNRKVAEKRQSAAFSDASVEITKDPSDSTPISQVSVAISDSEAESFVQGSSIDLLSTPEISLLADESPVSTVTNKDFHIDADQIQSIVDLPTSVESLRAEISDLKKLISSAENHEERNCIDGVLTRKSRIVLLVFILWAVLAAIVVSVRSGEKIAYYGPLPT
ncbi:BnaA01g32700D [Brassica napus]|uniref:BnaA01g32700D protein n=1 Tax=Brassica napus TaxID=3708 RepID=A0A078HBW8_BRANA|nr:BnaA01g32700D [Brassica napus]